jgi:hypothetical protein
MQLILELRSERRPPQLAFERGKEGGEVEFGCHG